MHPMLKLLVNNRMKGDFRSEQHGNEATIYLYDMIVDTDAEAEFWGGVSAESFVKQVRDLKVDTIHLRINSPGGSVFAGRAMEQALRDHPANVIAYVDGYAASASTFPTMAANEVVMNKGGFFMIHKAWTIAMGNSDDLLSTADLLEKIDNSLVTTYADRTGKDKEQIKEWLQAETWFGAEDAVAAGFADRIAEGVKVDNKAWDLSAFEHAPKVDDSAPVRTPAPVADPEPKPEPAPEYSEEHMNDLASRLRLAVTV